MSHVRIELPDQINQGRRRLELDQRDITNDIRGFRLAAHAIDDRNRLELELNLPTGEAEADVTVTLTPSQHELLRSLGWTPPGKHRQAVAEEIARALEGYIGFRDASKAAAVAREVGARVPKGPTL